MTNIDQDKKAAWLGELAEFIVEANQQTWAADKGEVQSPLPGMKVHEYKKGPWLLRDEYAGYFTAPGLTRVWYKEIPSWHMFYGGYGMETPHYDLVKPAFIFLRNALMQVTPDLPFRGPKSYSENDWKYYFKIKTPGGNIQYTQWEELVDKQNNLIFSQEGFAGIYIHKDSNRQPVYPWNT
jgi:hypothetical protein